MNLFKKKKLKRMEKYSLTEEHRAQMKPWADKWIANALSTRPMDDTDREICRDAVKRLYQSANLTPPPDHRIVFVSSPFIMRFAGGFAAAIWYLRKNKKPATSAATRAATSAATDDATGDATYDATYDATHDATHDATRAATHAATRAATYAATHAATRAATYAATDDATYDATGDATDDATYAATHDATGDATDDATYAATHAATRAATYAATDDATSAATYAATYDATDDATDDATGDATYAATRAATHDATGAATYAATYAATRAATSAATDDATYDATYDAKWYLFPISGMQKLSFALGIGELGLRCAANAYNFWQGGNQWSAWVAFLSFFRHVAKLSIDYSKWDTWEKLAEHSGPRIVHEKFCIISDRPEILRVDVMNRPHCETGPFCRWRDGSGLYALNGVRVPVWLVETPAEKLSAKKIMSMENAEQRKEGIWKMGIDRMRAPLKVEILHRYKDYELWTLEFEARRIGPYLKMVNPSTGQIHVEGVGEITGNVDYSIKTCQEALAWRNNMKIYWEPKILT